MIFKTVESALDKRFFYSGCKKLWLAQNSFPAVNKLNEINVKKRAKSISTFDFSIIYVAIPHKLLKVVSDIISFAFKSNVRKYTGFYKTSIYWTSKGDRKINFISQCLVNVMLFHC